MFFTSPWWLFGLLPWAVLTLWLLWGQRHRVQVPFLQLWPRLQPHEHAKRSLELPPPALAALILAMLLAVLASAGPRLRIGQADGPDAAVIVDRGITMSAHGGQRYAAAVADAARVLRETLGEGRVELTLVPGSRTVATDRRGWASKALAVSPTAMDTVGAVESAVARLLSQGRPIVVVVSDRKLDISDARIVPIAPAGAIGNVALTRLAVRQGQVMVRVENESSIARAVLVVRSDGVETSRQDIELPGRGASRDYFADLRRPGMVVEAELLAKDDLEGDNRRVVVQRGAWPAIEAHVPLPPELRRMADSYTSLRPPGNTSGRVLIAGSTQELAAGEAAVLLSAPASAAAGIGVSATVREHPVTASVSRWPAAGGTDAVGWDPVVSVGGRVIVGVREGPPRRVLVSADLENWSRSADFVVFWTNVFDWLGASEPQYVSEEVRELGAEWKPVAPHAGVENGLWPGLYRRTDGATIALHAGSAKSAVESAGNPAERLSALRQQGSAGLAGRATGPWLLTAAAILVLLAGLLWRKGE
ncbi:MAG: hypothetical protein ABSH20_25310 [Tepidisphaeraceae bacterium]|jgi:hypothetical protein